jgi:hypothetical protein
MKFFLKSEDSSLLILKGRIRFILPSNLPGGPGGFGRFLVSYLAFLAEEHRFEVISKERFVPEEDTSAIFFERRSERHCILQKSRRQNKRMT